MLYAPPDVNGSSELWHIAGIALQSAHITSILVQDKTELDQRFSALLSLQLVIFPCRS
jgi:hypothetical protein